MMGGRRLAIVAGGAMLGAALWWRTHPSACPYSQRFWVETPHPFITRARLRDILEPKPGERILEVGPGTGYYTLSVAEWIGPNGQLDIFDIQQEMLRHTLGRASEQGLTNISATQGDAHWLSYADATFDAAYLVATLGEIPDQLTALRELGRVLKPGGRVVVGELFGDPHWVSPKSLATNAQRAGLRFDSKARKGLGYFARFSAV